PLARPGPLGPCRNLLAFLARSVQEDVEGPDIRVHGEGREPLLAHARIEEVGLVALDRPLVDLLDLADALGARPGQELALEAGLVGLVGGLGAQPSGPARGEGVADEPIPRAGAGGGDGGAESPQRTRRPS